MSDIKNAVINGVLCYLSSARHTLTDQAMCTICLSFYNNDKISEAKELLFKIGNETTVKRRGEAKAKADLMDIINLLRKLDENSANVPKFLADNFCSMPPASGFETIAEHIINLTMEISTLKNEIQNLKDQPSGNSLTDMKEDIYDIKNILLQKTTSCKFQPNVAPHIDTTDRRLFADVVASPVNTRSSDNVVGRLPTIIKRNNTLGVQVEERDKHQIATANDKKKLASPEEPMNQWNKVQHSSEQSPNGGNQIIELRENGWQLHQTKRKRAEVIKGTKKVVGSLKGVNNCDLYIGKCDDSVTPAIISSYIKDENNIDVISCECLNEYNGVKSFKVTLSFENRNKLLMSSAWPENIVVRNFYTSKTKK